jgi:NAD-dependent deacetylase
VVRNRSQGVTPDVARAAELVAAARRIVVFSGAGISTESGIPDFRGPNGTWTRNPDNERLATLSYYKMDPELRKRAWRIRLDSPMRRAEPNAAHLAVASLDAEGRLVAVVTQNIDGLHQAAGLDSSKVIEVHGTFDTSECLGCDDRRPMPEVLERVRAGEEDPACTECGGVLKSATIFFGQSLVPKVIDAAFAAAQSCDLVLAVGTTLSVYPAARVVPIARESGARVVIVNGESTEMDHLADAVVKGRIGDVVPTILSARDDQSRLNR